MVWFPFLAVPAFTRVNRKFMIPDEGDVEQIPFGWRAYIWHQHSCSESRKTGVQIDATVGTAYRRKPRVGGEPRNCLEYAIEGRSKTLNPNGIRSKLSHLPLLLSLIHI